MLIAFSDSFSEFIYSYPGGFPFFQEVFSHSFSESFLLLIYYTPGLLLLLEILFLCFFRGGFSPFPLSPSLFGDANLQFVSLLVNGVERPFGFHSGRHGLYHLLEFVRFSSGEVVHLYGVLLQNLSPKWLLVCSCTS